jgi:hypothetical protein
VKDSESQQQPSGAKQPGRLTHSSREAASQQQHLTNGG